MSRLLPGFHETWADADAAFESFVATFPERRAQLRDRLVDTGGPELDGSIESLDALNEWHNRMAFEDQHDGMDGWPEWQDPAIRGREPSPLIDEGFRQWPVDPIGIANAGVVRSSIYFGVGDDQDVPPDPAEIRKSVEKRFTLNRDRRVSEDRSWQKARYGRGAGTRGPERAW